ISCEACHGPGREHVEYHQNALHRYGQHLTGGPDPTIVNPERCTTEVSVMICGRCHSSSQPIDLEQARKHGIQYRAGDDDLAEHLTFADFEHLPELEDYYAKDKVATDGVEAPTSGHTFSKVFWKDGTCRVGGDEYTAHIKSPCYLNGELTCLSCHSMHESDPNDQLATGMNTNEACLQCHESFRETLEAHTHHAADSSGSQCYNCHMPHTTYALSTAMRSHRIDSPDVQRSADTGRPDACNLCHLDQSLAWTSEYLHQWYDQPVATLTAEQATLPASLLWLLKGNAIQRAIAAWHFGWEPALSASGSGWQPAFLLEMLTDPYAQVRFIAHRALRGFDGYRPDTFPYDFWSPEEDLRDYQQTGFTKWNTDHPPGSELSDRIIELIGDESLASFLKTMSGARDNTPIEIPE
ncbi:MAG: cytochrome c3 family protein, partial [Pirellulales bacterium]|nr:cytochrome c3 family protein [Pirellulales bacterium]